MHLILRGEFVNISVSCVQLRVIGQNRFPAASLDYQIFVSVAV